MATEKVFQIKKWLGLNQCQDSDTKLKMGEAAIMRNWRVTRDGNLQRRPGTIVRETLASNAPVKGLWSGFVSSTAVLLGACDGKLYSLMSAGGEWQKVELGSVDTSGDVRIFGFSDAAYILSATEYKVWDGTTLANVEGYIPLVTVSVPPAGGGTELENINRLNGKRRSWFSPDGTSMEFVLPEKGMTSIDSVINTATGQAITGYTADTANGKVTFSSAPAAGVNAIEISWTMPTSFRSQVIGMRFSELYNSTQDTRVFLYGDGTNKCIYSGMDYNGEPRADYFPDLYEIAVGDSNTPIMAMIRHYSKLICFKSNSTYSISYGSVTLENGSVTAAFYSTPINRTIGANAAGQASLVLNSPRTLFGHDIYEWHNSASYSSNLTIDERQAKRISDRVAAALKNFDIPDCVCYDDNYNQEYWICYRDKAIVNNYAVDAWYTYEGINVACMETFGDKLVFGTPDGKIKEVTYAARCDIDGETETAIDSYWESGDMTFGSDYMRKFSTQLWIGIAPTEKSEVTVTVETDRSSELAEKQLAEKLTVFEEWDFADFEFAFDLKPKIHKLKIKAKKFVYYKLIFKTNNTDSNATVTSADIKVTFMGYAK